MLLGPIARFCVKSEQLLLTTHNLKNTIRCTTSVLGERNIKSNLGPKINTNSPQSALANRNKKNPQSFNAVCIKRYALFLPNNDGRPIPKIITKNPRNYTTSSSQDGDQNGPQKMRVPRLILIQNPFTWLMTKFDFSVLRSLWDPTFEEKDFKIGTKQAISRVTQLLAKGRYADLSGLLTRSAKATLLRELETSWPERQKNLISLSNDDIQITSPRKIYFIRVAEKKFCAVDVAFLALKWASAKRTDGLVFAEIFARFHREYTACSIPEWTIACFKVTRFDILRKK